VAKEEIAPYEQFRIFPQCFQMLPATKVSKCAYNWEWFDNCKRLKRLMLSPVVTQAVVCVPPASCRYLLIYSIFLFFISSYLEISIKL